MYSEHQSKVGINLKVCGVILEKLEHSVVALPQQKREDVVVPLNLNVKLVKLLHDEALVVFGFFLLKQLLQFPNQRVLFDDVFRRALDHLSKRAEVLRSGQMQEQLGVEGRGQESGFFGSAFSLFFRGNHVDELCQLSLLHHFLKPMHSSFLVDP